MSENWYLEVPVSVLRDVLHPELFMQGGTSKLTNNPSLVSRIRHLRNRAETQLSTSLVFPH